MSATITELGPDLHLCVESHSEFQTVAVGLWVFSGSDSESKPDVFGYSHLTEHLVFKGTKERKAIQIAEELEAQGGDLNAFTDREMTCYHATILKKDLPLAVDILSDLLFQPTFQSKELEKEKGVILQEIAMVEDSVEEWAHDLLYEMCWKSHPSGHSILGTKKSVSQATRSKVMKWHQGILNQSRLCVSVAGPVDPTEFSQLLREKCLPRWKSAIKKTAPSNLPAKKPSPFERGLYFVEKDTEQTQIVLGFPGLPFFHHDRYALFLLSTYLGGGMSSRLFQRIREEMGLAYSVGTNVSSLSYQGLFDVSVGTAPQATKKVIEALKFELDRVRKKKLDDKSLQMIKNKFIGSLWLSADSMESRMNSLAKNLLVFQRYVPIQEVADEIQRVSSADIQRVARDFMDDQSACSLILGPKNSVKGMKNYEKVCPS